jgi:hypothetical protein
MTTLPSAYGATRAALHAVAEHVLSPALHRATGRIGLRTTPGGFGTPWFPAGDGERQVRIDGTALVVAERDGSEREAAERRGPLRTVGEAATFARIAPGAPAGVYPPVTPLEPDRRLALDPVAAGLIHEWFDLTGRALDAFRRTHVVDEPSIAQLWPEHFDLAISMAEVNYGGSPGDDGHAGPYLYVGPWRLDGRDDAFWNEPFGASLAYDQVRTVDDAVAFFTSGRRLASKPR